MQSLAGQLQPAAGQRVTTSPPPHAGCTQERHRGEAFHVEPHLAIVYMTYAAEKTEGVLRHRNISGVSAAFSLALASQAMGQFVSNRPTSAGAPLRVTPVQLRHIDDSARGRHG